MPVLEIALAEGGELSLSLVGDAVEFGAADRLAEGLERLEIYIIPGSRPVAIMRSKDGTQRTFDVGKMIVSPPKSIHEPGEKLATKSRKGGEV